MPYIPIAEARGFTARLINQRGALFYAHPLTGPHTTLAAKLLHGRSFWQTPSVATCPGHDASGMVSLPDSTRSVKDYVLVNDYRTGPRQGSI